MISYRLTTESTSPWATWCHGRQLWLLPTCCDVPLPNRSTSDRDNRGRVTIVLLGTVPSESVSRCRSRANEFENECPRWQRQPTISLPVIGTVHQIVQRGRPSVTAYNVILQIRWHANSGYRSASVQVGTDGRVLSPNAPCPLSPPFTAARQSSHVPPGARTLKLPTALCSSASSFVLCVLSSKASGLRGVEAFRLRYARS